MTYEAGGLLLVHWTLVLEWACSLAFSLFLGVRSPGISVHVDVDGARGVLAMNAGALHLVDGKVSDAVRFRRLLTSHTTATRAEAASFV